MNVKPRLLPFYMTYPLPLFYEEGNTVKKDLEYLQQMYPKEAKHFQRMVHDTLKILDYEGSFIYDEFPDRLQLERITEQVVQKIRIQEKEHPKDSLTETENESAEKWSLVKEMVQVILYYEIYKKRHADATDFLTF